VISGALLSGDNPRARQAWDARGATASRRDPKGGIWKNRVAEVKPEWTHPRQASPIVVSVTNGLYNKSAAGGIGEALFAPK
jgi:YD repeat-containing protein